MDICEEDRAHHMLTRRLRCLFLNDLMSPVSGNNVPWCTRARMHYNYYFRARYISPWWDWKIVHPLKREIARRKRKCR